MHSFGYQYTCSSTFYFLLFKLQSGQMGIRMFDSTVHYEIYGKHGELNRPGMFSSIHTVTNFPIIP